MSDLQSMELYADFKVTNYGFGIRRIEYSPMLATMEIYKEEKRHYYGVEDFFGDTSAKDCQDKCLSLMFKMQQEAGA
jgi:hypothetical protein